MIKILIYSLVFLVAIVIAVLAYNMLSSGPYTENKTYSGTIDINRYSGTWYQILEARNNNSWLFEKMEKTQGTCYATRVVYEAVGTKLQLRNSCNDGGFDGREVSITGIVTPQNASNTKLKVRFDPWYLRAFTFDYWIVDIDPNYQLVTLSSPKSKGITILSRVPIPDKALYEKAKANAEALGYDLSKSMISPQR